MTNVSLTAADATDISVYTKMCLYFTCR